MLDKVCSKFNSQKPGSPPNTWDCVATILKVVMHQKSGEEHQKERDDEESMWQAISDKFLKDITEEHATEDMEIYVIHGKAVYTEDKLEDAEFSKFFSKRKDSLVVEVADPKLFEARKQEIIKLSKHYTFPHSDDYRDPNAGYYGGF
mmetsp:Transcript_19441/g.14109  ORF Transcript_19441/g.14109 Transcript_19441/m.14109 type:complete len:147 (+) Transcript_19441:1060-1500(+)